MKRTANHSTNYPLPGLADTAETTIRMGLAFLIVAVIVAMFALAGCADTRATYRQTPEALEFDWLNQKNFSASGVDITTRDGSHVHFDKISNDPQAANAEVWGALVRMNQDTQAALPGTAAAIIQAAKHP